MSGCTRILGSGEQQQQSTPRLALGLVDRGRGDDIPVSADLSSRGNDAHDTPAIPEPTLPSPRKTPTRRSTSHFFAAPAKSGADASVKSPRPPGGTVSALPFPPLTAQQFGLIQEELANDPFRLLIAITFLIKTRGKTAIPVFRALMEKYPTPEALAAADAADITAQIKHLGLSVVRAAQIQKYARTWLETPPTRDRRYGVKNYPRKGDGGGVRGGEPMGPEEEDPRESAWEIGHLTQGPYALDSWRIFCRDALLGRAKDWKGRGRDGQFQPEWMRVLVGNSPRPGTYLFFFLFPCRVVRCQGAWTPFFGEITDSGGRQPLDKELRAYLRWMWMQEGWSWDPTTGERDVLSKELQSAVNEGRVAWDNTGALRIAVGPG